MLNPSVFSNGHHATTSADFDLLWKAAREAGDAAAKEANAKLGDESRRGFDCGFAWFTFPGNIPFAKWTKKQGISSKGYPTGQQIWYSKTHSVPTQSISVHEAACRAVRDVLSHGLQSSMISTGSRLD